MNISSILITILGIIIILALYVMSRYGQRNSPKKEITKIPEIKDSEGNKFSSVLDDIPASDDASQEMPQQKDSSSNQETKIDSASNAKKQIVLFISGKDEEGLDGPLLQQVLLKNDLKLGDKDIYHYYFNNNDEVSSLFRIANGVEPWTLKDSDLLNKKVIGVSMVMLLPSTVNNKEATSLFMKMADTITEQANGVLKNQQQELLSIEDRNNILSS